MLFRAAALSAAGHVWVGLDLSGDMLSVARARGVEGDLMLSDMGQGFGFRPGSFDGAISVSAVQWLCHSTTKAHRPFKRIQAFFASLYRCLRRGARAVLQVYPDSPRQMEMLTTAALRCGFSGGVVVDYPNSAKAKKFFLCLSAGVDSTAAPLPEPRGVDAAAGAGGALPHETRRGGKKKGKKQLHVRSGSLGGAKPKDWVVAKKERMRKQGKKVARNSRYTGRKRPDSLVR